LDNDFLVDNPYEFQGINQIGDIHPIISPSMIEGTFVAKSLILFPTSGTYSRDQYLNIQFTRSYSTDDHYIEYLLEYSNDGGSSWTWLTVVSEWKGYYRWNLEMVEPGQEYLLKISVESLLSGEIIDFSEIFSIIDGNSPTNLPTPPIDNRGIAIIFLLVILGMLLIQHRGKLITRRK
jgi:hypothetical protein